MSGATGEVLQEYLVKLGFQTDSISLKKFEDGMGKTGKSVMRLGLGVAGVVASVEAAAAAFAYSMRKTYFAAELADTSVKKMQAMSYAGKQFGISGDSMAGAIKGMAQAMRLNPGLQGLVESFGVRVTGRDKADVMMDFVKAIKQMPEFVGQQYAAMFGMDADTFHQVREHFDEIIGKREELSRLQKEAGFDIDAQKKNILAYTQAMDKLSARFEIFAGTFLSAMSPVFTKSMEWLDNLIVGWTYIFADDKQKKAMIRAYGKGGTIEQEKKRAAAAAQGGAATTPQGEDPRALHERIIRGETGAAVTPAATIPGDKRLPRNQRNNNPGNIEYGQFAIAQGATGSDGRFAIFPTLEAGYAAQQKLLAGYGKKGINTIAGVVNRWAPSHENDSGAYAAYVAKQMGIGVNDKIDLQDPAIQAGLSKHMSRYEGMPASALAAADRARLGGGGGTVVTQNNTTTIQVSGGGAESTARAVAREQNRVNADATRTLKGAVS